MRNNLLLLFLLITVCSCGKERENKATQVRPSPRLAGWVVPEDAARWILEGDVKNWDIVTWRKEHNSPEEITAVRDAIVKRLSGDVAPEEIGVFLLYAEAFGVAQDHSTHQVLRRSVELANAHAREMAYRQHWYLVEHGPDGPVLMCAMARH